MTDIGYGRIKGCAVMCSFFDRYVNEKLISANNQNFGFGYIVHNQRLGNFKKKKSLANHSLRNVRSAVLFAIGRKTNIPALKTIGAGILIF